MLDDVSTPLRNSTPESLRLFLEGLEDAQAKEITDRRRQLERTPDADVTPFDRRIRDFDLRIEATKHICEAYVQLEQARDCTKGQSEASTRVELTKLLLAIDQHFIKKA